MTIALNRSSSVSFHDQIVTQIELGILSATLRPGHKLPSTRTLARRLGIHANTVAAAYRTLRSAGHVRPRRGSGLFVLGDKTGSGRPVRSLDEIIQGALETAFARGFTSAEVRAALARWLAATPLERVLVLDSDVETAELLAAELREFLPLEVTHASLDDLARKPARADAALLVAVPYHLAQVHSIAPEAACEALTLEMGEAERRAIAALADGAIVLLVSHARTVLPFATVLLRSLRGDEVLVETCALAEARRWRRLAAAADLVLTDVVSFEQVARLRPRALREYHIISAEARERVRAALGRRAAPLS